MRHDYRWTFVRAGFSYAAAGLAAEHHRYHDVVFVATFVIASFVLDWGARRL